MSMTKDQINDAANTISNLIVNCQEVHDLIHQAVCEDLEIDPNKDLSEKFETDEAFESKYYAAGARYWSAITIRSAVQLDSLTK